MKTKQKTSNMKTTIKEIKEHLKKEQIVFNELNAKMTKEFTKRFNFDKEKYKSISLTIEGFEIYWHYLYFHINDVVVSFVIILKHSREIEIFYKKNYVGEKGEELMMKFINENFEDLLDFFDIEKTNEIKFKPF